MLGIKFDNSTTCKIDGWLRNTINGSKPDSNDAPSDESDSEQSKLTDGRSNARTTEIRRKNPGNKPHEGLV